MALFNSNTFIKDTSNSDVTRIIAITGLMFVILFFIRVSFLMNNTADSFFTTHFWNSICLPSTFSAFAKQPWSIVAYMFIHNSTLAMISSMIWVWVFGSPLEDQQGRNSSLLIFILGGIIGAVFLYLYVLVFPSEALHLYYTPNAGITALAAASIYKSRQYPFLLLKQIPISIGMFGILYAILLISMNTSNIHLWVLCIGGGICGLLCMSMLKPVFQKMQQTCNNISNYIWDNKNFMDK